MISNLTSFCDSLPSPEELSPLDLAFAGDAVFELLVREELLRGGRRPVKTLHAMSVERVRASSQAKGAAAILPLLSEEEADVYRRARNAKVGGVPKNASAAEYHAATALEALFGWLWLKGNTDRIMQLYAVISEGACTEDD